jgi:hypothetical protein
MAFTNNIDITKLEGWTGGINPNGMYDNNLKFPKINQFEVTCKDGTKDVSNGIVAPCLSRGGISISTKDAYLKTTKEPIYYIAITTGALVVGYLIWKKFKK